MGRRGVAHFEEFDDAAAVRVGQYDPRRSKSDATGVISYLSTKSDANLNGFVDAIAVNQNARSSRSSRPTTSGIRLSSSHESPTSSRRAAAATRASASSD